MIDEEALNEELNKRQMKIDELEDLLKTRSSKVYALHRTIGIRRQQWWLYLR